MSVALTPNYTQRVYTWAGLKAAKTIRGFVYQYDEDAEKYTIWGYDDPEVHVCTIYKGTLPYAVAEIYSQEQNDIDKADFENGPKPIINQAISGNKFRNIAGNATTVVKPTSGRLVALLINNSNSGGTVTLYDNTAANGTVIATFTVGTASGALGAGQQVPTYLGPLDIVFQNGLTIVTAGGPPQNNITAIYR
jgi:hypothetical protein